MDGTIDNGAMIDRAGADRRRSREPMRLYAQFNASIRELEDLDVFADQATVG